MVQLWEMNKHCESQLGFGDNSPYWKGVAQNEYHFYEVVLTATAN